MQAYYEQTCIILLYRASLNSSWQPGCPDLDLLIGSLVEGGATDQNKKKTKRIIYGLTLSFWSENNLAVFEMNSLASVEPRGPFYSYFTYISRILLI